MVEVFLITPLIREVNLSPTCNLCLQRKWCTFCWKGCLVVSDTMFYEDIIEIVVVVVEYELIVEVYKDSKDKEYVLR